MAKDKEGCSTCGQMRNQMGEAIREADPSRVVKVARAAIKYNYDKATKGKEHADSEYRDRARSVRKRDG